MYILPGIVPPSAEETGSKPDARNGWTILLAGGGGSRLSRFVSRFHPDDRPKQFATLIGTRSMVQHTFDRALRHSLQGRVVTVISKGQERWASAQLPEELARNLLVQPLNLDTGPAICLAVAHVMASEPEACVLILPTDHFVFPEHVLAKHIFKALAALSENGEMKTVLFGAAPSGPLEGMGWILPGDPAGEDGRTGFRKVRGFIEKPRSGLAARLYASGAMWNTFIMAGRARHLWHLFEKRVPEAASRIARFHRLLTQGGARCMQEESLQEVAPFNFSSQILEREPGEFVVTPLEGVAWSDWGTPKGVEETLKSMGWTYRMERLTRKRLIAQEASFAAASAAPSSAL